MTPAICIYSAIAIMLAIALYEQCSKVTPRRTSGNAIVACWYAVMWAPILVLALLSVFFDACAATKRSG